MGFGFLQDYGYLELYGPNGIFRQIKAALILGTGDGAYIILGIGMKQKKYMRLLVVQAILKAKAQKRPY